MVKLNKQDIQKSLDSTDWKTKNTMMLPFKDYMILFLWLLVMSISVYAEKLNDDDSSCTTQIFVQSDALKKCECPAPNTTGNWLTI